MNKYLLWLATLLLMTAISPAAKAQTAHSVNLTWSPSPTANIAGYNIYRAACFGTVTAGVCSGAAGAYGKIGTVNASTLAYSDTSVNANDSKFYYVTAYCATGTPCAGESGPSNTIAVQVPPNPAVPPVAPTNLQGVPQ
jgi:hypothetical protein